MIEQFEAQEIPDHYKHVKSNIEIKYKQMLIIFKVTFVLVILSSILLVYCIIYQTNGKQADDLKNGNNAIKANNTQIEQANSYIEQQIKILEDKNKNLQSNITILQIQVNKTNQKIKEIQTDINENCNNLNQKVHFNQTNLNYLQISILAAKDNGKTSVIAYLNISQNNLSKFCENSLPDTQVLDLRNNPITNISYNSFHKITNLQINQKTMVQQFSGNYLPLLKSLDLTLYGIVTFKDNIFDQLYYLNLDQNKITELSNYNIDNLQTLSLRDNPIKILYGNNFPVLNSLTGLQDLNTLIQVRNNNFGKIHALQLNSNSQVLLFQQNTLLSLTYIKFDQCSYDYSSLVLNQMPLLNKIQINNCNISNFQYFAQFRLLILLNIDSKTIQSFSNHEYPNLQSLILKQMNELITFENNKLPLLQDLMIGGALKLIDICKGTLMPNLKTAYLDATSIKDIDCLSTFERLVFLAFYTHSITLFDNFKLPLLQKLIFRGGLLTSFNSNYLPSLLSLIIQINATSISLQSFRNLKFLEIYGPIKKFSNYQLPQLQVLTLSVNNQPTQFTNNIFRKLQQLHLINFIFLPNFTQSTFGHLKIFHLIRCSSQFTLQSIFDNSLQEILVSQSNLTNYSNHEMPNLQKLQITNGNLSKFQQNYLPKAQYISLSQNNLTVFTCNNQNSLDKLQYLILSNNKLDDTVADSLIFCSINSLQILSLTNNNIKDIQNVRVKLLARYPSAAIQL